MKTVFHLWKYGRFIEIQSKLRRKKLHKTNKGFNFLRGSFSNKVNVAKSPNPIFKRKVTLTSSSRTNPSIFTSIAPVLLDQPNETS